jgi:hypothetical protein
MAHTSLHTTAHGLMLTRAARSQWHCRLLPRHCMLYIHTREQACVLLPCLSFLQRRCAKCMRDACDRTRQTSTQGMYCHQQYCKHAGTVHAVRRRRLDTVCVQVGPRRKTWQGDVVRRREKEAGAAWELVKSREGREGACAGGRG